MSRVFDDRTEIRARLLSYCRSKQEDATRSLQPVHVETTTTEINVAPTGNILLGKIISVIQDNPQGCPEVKILEVLKKSGFRYNSAEDIKKTLGDRAIELDHEYFLREKCTSVYVLIKTIENERVLENGGELIQELGDSRMYKFEVTKGLLELFREFGSGDMILDDEVNRIFNLKFTPKERMQQEIMDAFMDLF